MTEAVLRNRVLGPDDMLGQIKRLREVAQMPNVTLSVIPADAKLEVPPYHGFELLDDRLVAVDVFNTLVRTRGRSDIELYALAFDALAKSATVEFGPILDRYRAMYLDRSKAQLG